MRQERFSGKLIGLAISLFFPLALAAQARGEFPLEGFTEPYQRVELSATEPGVVSKLLAQDGDHVQNGQLLAQLENEPLVAAVELAQAAAESKGRLQAAQAEQSLRSRRLIGLEKLHEKGHATLEEVHRARTDLEIAEANCRVVQEQQKINELELNRAQTLLERRNVRSTLNGVIISVHHQPGEFISGNSPTLFSIVRTDKLAVNFAVPPMNSMSIKAGQRIPVQFPDASLTAVARVEFVSPVTDPESGTIRVRVVIDNERKVYPCGVKCVLVPQSMADALSRSE